LLCDDRKVILKSFEYEITVETYYKALNNMKDITAEQQIMINAQHTIKEDYNNIKFMRDALAYKQVKRNDQIYN
jgi:hypothetical protein